MADVLNFGDILDAIGEVLGPDDLALAHGDRRISWPDMTARSNRLARNLRRLGAETGDKIGFYMRNRPEYMEGLAAAFKARLTHVNVNYRYLADELFYIFDNSDSTVVLFGAEFADNIEAIRHRLPKVKAWVQIGGSSVADFAQSYEELATTGDDARLGIERSADDLLFLYTGGTTGMPKGVMWSQNIWRLAAKDTADKAGVPYPMTLDEYIPLVELAGRLTRQIPACPLMHGTGLFTAMGAMLGGGAVITLEQNSGFDPVDLFNTVDRHKATALAIVGDAFGKPMLKTLDENPTRWDVSSVQAIVSSGVMWSLEVKQGLLRHMPQAAMQDSFGASEAVGFGSSVTTAEAGTLTSKFEIGPTCKVFAEDDREIIPGSGEAGFIARGGAVPLGYYKDEAKTAKTFRTINGERYAIPGDWCTVEKDGTITLLGRGSNCINTAGEKVYPEEVEEALKEHDAVTDALVVGVPDDKWGQAVTAVVAIENSIDARELTDFVKGRIAHYKAPKSILFKDDLGRAPNGKADYKSIRAYALSELGISQ